MVKSKRNKVVNLTKVAKKGSSAKEKLINDVREAATSYNNMFVVKVVNMRNNKFKDLREDLEESRFFLGKNKVMSIGLGLDEETEIVQGSHRVSELLHGGAGLLLSNKPVDEIIEFFNEYEVSNFARSGFIATSEFTLPAGLLEDQPFSIEPQLRKLGLPTKLDHGKIYLVKDAVVCKKGDTLTPSQAKLLELFGMEMAIMKVYIQAHLDLKTGAFEEYEVDDVVDDADEDNEAMDD